MKDIDNPLVSVIIPMYNVGEVFEACLDNLIKQTYRPLEVIMLDDASKDHTRTLIEDSRQILEAKGISLKAYFAPQNRGVAAMRNEGFILSEGKYIYSYDADDYMAPSLIEELVQRAEQDNAQIVGCNWYLRYESQDRAMTQPQPTTGLQMYEALCYGIMKWNVWLYLVRRDLFGQAESLLSYTEGDNMGEDMLMMTRLALRAERVSIVDKHLYYYVKTNAQAQTATYKDEHWQQVARNYSNLQKYVESYNPLQSTLLNYLKLNLKLPLIISTRQQDYKHWEEWYSESNAYVMSNPHLSVRTKAIQWLASKKQWWLVWLYNKIVMQWLYNLLYK